MRSNYSIPEFAEREREEKGGETGRGAELIDREARSSADEKQAPLTWRLILIARSGVIRKEFQESD